MTVLEAGDRPGGRIRTDRSLGIPFDEGASWIHGPNRNPITDLATDSGAQTFLTDDDNVQVFDISGTPYTDSNLTTEENNFEGALATVRSAGTTAQSFEVVFNNNFPGQSQDRLWKYMLSAYLEFDTGGDIAWLSSKYFDDDEAFGGDDLIITNGYDTITDFMAQDLDIRLNTPVSAINYVGEGVTVEAGSGSFEADYVIVTVPLGVLKANTINFTPGLPADKLDAISLMGMGNINKFLGIWSTPFWDPNVQYIGYTPEEKGKFNYFLNMQKFSSVNGLMTFAFGDYAHATESLSDAQISDAITTHLRNIYGSATPPPDSLLRTRWGQDPLSFGAYSYAANGAQPSDFDTIAVSLNNNLYFAGEHTDREYRGTVHGAYLSGIREAEKIIDL